MIRRKKGPKKKELEEQLVQKFPYRCPYCDQAISYNQFDLKVGENEIQCFWCKKIYIKVVLNSHDKKSWSARIYQE